MSLVWQCAHCIPPPSNMAWTPGRCRVCRNEASDWHARRPRLCHCMLACIALSDVKCLFQRPPRGRPDGGLFKKLVDNLKQGTGDKELNTSLKLFEEKLTEINELESIKKAKEIIAQAKVRKLKWAHGADGCRRMSPSKMKPS